MLSPSVLEMKKLKPRFSLEGITRRLTYGRISFSKYNKSIPVNMKVCNNRQLPRFVSFRGSFA
jgi:hypothetical protein